MKRLLLTTRHERRAVVPNGDCLSRNGTVNSGSRLESAVNDDVGVVVLLARSECEIGLKKIVLDITVLQKEKLTLAG